MWFQKGTDGHWWGYALFLVPLLLFQIELALYLVPETAINQQLTKKCEKLKKHFAKRSISQC